MGVDNRLQGEAHHGRGWWASAPRPGPRKEVQGAEGDSPPWDTLVH